MATSARTVCSSMCSGSTLGTKVVCQGATGRIADVGAAAVGDARAILGFALLASATVGDVVPVALK